MAISIVPDDRLSIGYRKALYIADSSNDAIRRVLLTDFLFPTSAPTYVPSQSPTQNPTSPTASPTFGKPRTLPPTLPSKAPSTIPTRAPSPTPTPAPTSKPSIAKTAAPTLAWTGNWTLQRQCKNCQTTIAFPGVTNFTCDCPIGTTTQYAGSSCFSSCCPAGQVYHDDKGLLQCMEPGRSCNVVNKNNTYACPSTRWLGTYNGSCINCYEIPSYGITQLKCDCRNIDGQYGPTFCYSSCGLPLFNKNGCLRVGMGFNDGNPCAGRFGDPCPSANNVYDGRFVNCGNSVV